MAATSPPHVTVSLMRPFVDSAFRGTPEFAWEWLAAMAAIYPDRLCMPAACRAKHHAMYVGPDSKGTALAAVNAAPGVVEDALRRCSGIRFSAWVLVFQSRGDEVHGNALVFDRDAKRMVRFEPRGWRVGYDSERLDTTLAAYAKDTFGATYTSPRDLQGPVGPQRREVLEVEGRRDLLPSHGPCVIWSLLFIALTLEYPDLTPQQVAEHLDKDCVSPRVLAQALGHFIAAHKPSMPMCERRDK